MQIRLKLGSLIREGGLGLRLRRVVQEDKPIPKENELVVWFNPVGNTVELVYCDETAGLVGIRLE